MLCILAKRGSQTRKALTEWVGSCLAGLSGIFRIGVPCHPCASWKEREESGSEGMHRTSKIGGLKSPIRSCAHPNGRVRVFRLGSSVNCPWSDRARRLSLIYFGSKCLVLLHVESQLSN